MDLVSVRMSEFMRNDQRIGGDLIQEERDLSPECEENQTLITRL